MIFLEWGVRSEAISKPHLAKCKVFLSEWPVIVATVVFVGSCTWTLVLIYFFML